MRLLDVDVFLAAFRDERPLFAVARVSPDAPDLYFIGYLDGHRALIPGAEAQAAWVAEAIAGRLVLPDAQAMRESIAAAVRARAFDPHDNSLIVDAHSYMRRLRREARRARRRPGPSRRASAASV